MLIPEKRYRVQLTLAEPILGTVGKDKQAYTSYVQAKQKAEAEKAGVDLTDEMLAEEANTIPDLEEKGWTGFMEDEDGNPFLLNYVIKGFFKDACKMLRKIDGKVNGKAVKGTPKTLSSQMKAYKQNIDGLVFIEPRRLFIHMNGAERGILERPLRASTPQGERVALAKSDTCPAGSTIAFTVVTIGDLISDEQLHEWFSYGNRRGLGQWRNADWGRFKYEMEEVPG